LRAAAASPSPGAARIALKVEVADDAVGFAAVAPGMAAVSELRAAAAGGIRAPIAGFGRSFVPSAGIAAWVAVGAAACAAAMGVNPG